MHFDRAFRNARTAGILASILSIGLHIGHLGGKKGRHKSRLLRWFRVLGFGVLRFRVLRR